MASGRRRPQRQKHGDSLTSDGNDVQLSKSLSYLLRHGAPKEKITIYPGGFLDVDEILELGKFKQWTVDNIRSVVENNDKQRFTLRNDENSGKLQICANQGHSFEIEDPLLDPITDPTPYPTVIHGTYLDCWKSIKKTGLNKMNRTHIHLATGEFGKEGVVSGMRKSAGVYIYVDMAKALQDGIMFYKSRNNVILTSGNEQGILDVKYFSKVLNVKTNELLTL